MGYYITPAAVIAVSVILPTLAATAVASRFVVRSRQASGYGIDDWLILAALVFTVTCGISLVVGAALKGLAQPTPTGDGPMGFLTAKNDALIITEKVDWVDMLLQCFSFGLTKMSVVFFYRRIFCNPANKGKAFDIISKITIGFVFIWMIAFFFVILFECKGHFWAQWDTLLALLTYCLDDTKIQLVFSYMDVITDVWILSLPLYPVWKLRLPPQKKLALCAVFLMGALAIAAGVVRLAFYIRLLTSSFKNPDGIRIITTQLYWSLIEMSLCIVAACLPTLKPLFNNLPTESFFSSLRTLFTNKSVNSSHFDLNEYNSTDRPFDGKSQGSQKSLV